MQTLMLVGHDAAYEPLAKLTVPLMYRYACMWDMDFERKKEPYFDIPNGIYWISVHGAIEALRSGYERVFALDVDQMVTNRVFRLPDWGFGLHFSKDWGRDAVEPWHFSQCAMVAHQDSLPLLEKVAASEPEWRDKPFPCQGPMQDAVRRMTDGLIFRDNDTGVAAAINIHPRKLFNAVPEEVCPGQVPEPWEPGDFLAHLTMLNISQRVKLFHDLRNR